MLDQLTTGIAFTGWTGPDAIAFLKYHGKMGVAAHVVRVAEGAKAIAARVGADPDAAEVAGYLHDVSQVLPFERMPEIAGRFGLEVLPAEREAPSLLHGKLSAVFAERLFGITDPSVLAAIRCHTTLRAGASLMDKVLLAADKLAWDPQDAPYVPEMSAALDRSLDEAIRVFFTWSLARRDTHRVLHPWFLAACAEFGVTAQPPA